MEIVKYLIIGGGVAGTSAAEAIRSKDPSGRIVVVSDEAHLFYSRILVSKPHFLLGTLPFEKVFLRNQDWYTKKQKVFFLYY